VKCLRNHVYEYTKRCSLVTLLIETEIRNTSANSKQNMAVMASNGPSTHFPSIRLGFPAPQPSRCHHAQCLLEPSFYTQERIMFSNLTPSEPRLSPAATISDDMLSALTQPLHCASILQPATPPQVVAFDSAKVK